jgi:hypothetical protein
VVKNINETCKDENFVQNSGWKTGKKRTLGRPKCGWEECIKMNYEEKGRVWTGFICLRIETTSSLF